MLPQFFRHVPLHLYHLALAVLVGFVLGLTMILASPILVLVAILSTVFCYLIYKAPVWGVLGMIALTSTFLSSDANLSFSIGVGHLYLTDILLAVLLACVAVRSLVDPASKLVYTSLNLPLFAFVFLAFLSTGVAIFQSSLMLQQSLGEIRNICNYLLFFAVINLVRDEKQIRFLTNGLLVLATLVSIAMIIQYALGPSIQLLPGRVEILHTEGISYAAVTRIIPPGYSLIFVGFIFLSVILPYNEFRSHQIWLIIPWLLTGLGVLLTFKRHLWGAAILIFLLMVLFGRRAELNRIIGWALSVFIVSIIGFFLITNITGSTGLDLLGGSISRLASLLDIETYEDPNSSLRWRDFEYKYALPQIESHPLLGLGLGARYRPFVPYRDHAEFDGRGFIHNGHIWIMVKIGLLGYSAMLGLMVSFVIRGLRSWRNLPTAGDRALVLGFTLAYIGMLIGTIVEPMLIEWRWTALLAVIMGLTEAVLRLHSIPEHSVNLTVV